MRKFYAALAAALALACPAFATVTGNPPPSVYTCNGTTTTYTISFPYVSSAHVVATVTTGTVTTTLALTTDYTVSPSTAPSVGTLTLTAGSKCPNGSTLTLTRNVPLTQPQSFRTGPYSGSAHEQAFDRIEMQLQQGMQATTPLHGTGTGTPLTIQRATSAQDGYLSAVDWNAFSTGGIGANTFTAPGGVAELVSDKLAEARSFNDYGAKGDGVTDDTATMQTALNTGKNIRGVSGATYLVNGGLTQNTPDQVIDMSGATVKLKNAAASKGILTLSGTGARVTGGTWDLNNTNNATGSAFDTWAVMANADYVVAEKMHIKNSFGIGIHAAGGMNHVEARFNRIENVALAGILFDGSATVGAVGVSAHHNRVDITNNTSMGIYVASASPFTFLYRRWRIQDNEIIGPTAGAAASSVGITGRGDDGIISGNHVIGCNIGISDDISAADVSNIISNNRVEGANGATFGYGIEVGGGRTLVVGNIVKGGTNAVVGSGSVSMDYLQIIGNQFDEQTAQSILIAPSGGATAQHALISGNMFVSKVTAQQGAVRLANDCRYSTISDNLFTMNGGGDVAIFLDAVNSDVSALGNRFDTVQFPMVAFNAAAVAQTNLAVNNSDMSHAVGSPPPNAITMSGAATAGAGIQSINTYRGSSGLPKLDILDKQLNLLEQVSNSFASPEGNLTAGPGSSFTFTGGGGATRFVKASGTGNTGWVGAVTGTIPLVAGTGTATVRSGASCQCTDVTATAAVRCNVVTTTLTATGTGTDSIAYLCF